MLRELSLPDAHGNRLVACDGCPYRRTTHWVLAQIHHDCEAQRKIARGPGTQLAQILQQLGAKRKAGCGCDEMIGRMNAWGVAGCRAHRAEIVAHLAGAYEGLSWGQRGTAAVLALATGLAWQLDPLDVYGALVDLAIARAE